MVLNPYSFHRINFAKPFDFVYEEAMTLEQLRIFLAVAERQHMTEAALARKGMQSNAGVLKMQPLPLVQVKNYQRGIAKRLNVNAV